MVSIKKIIATGLMGLCLAGPVSGQDPLESVLTSQDSVIQEAIRNMTEFYCQESGYDYESCFIHQPDVEQMLLDNAEQNQIFIYADNHYTLEEDYFLIYLMPKLFEMGYHDITIELDADYYQEWIDLIQEDKMPLSAIMYGRAYSLLNVISAANELGMNIHCIDEVPENYYDNGGDPSTFGTNRNFRMYLNMRRRIFVDNPDAKVIVFVGHWHANEEEAIAYHADGELAKTLGYYLNKYTDGGVYSLLLDTYGLESIRPYLDSIELKIGVFNRYSQERSNRYYGQEQSGMSSGTQQGLLGPGN